LSNIQIEPHVRKKKTVKLIILGLSLAIVVTLIFVYNRTASHQLSPKEKLAQEFYTIEDDKLYWDYEAMFKAYTECRDSIREMQLLDLMVDSRSAHLVPRIIDSIGPGGYINTERKIKAIIELTGHDFSKEFDITRIWKKEHVTKTERLLHQWWERNGEEVVLSKDPKKSFNVLNHWPSLSLDVKTEKNQYFQLEPIRITIILRNNSDTWFTFSYKLRKPAFIVEYFRVNADGSFTSTLFRKFLDYRWLRLLRCFALRNDIWSL